MGFLNQFKQQPQQQPQQQANPLPNILETARQLVGNDPRAALQQMANSGMTCNLPNGRVMSVSDLMKMAEGKTAQQLLDQLGIK